MCINSLFLFSKQAFNLWIHIFFGMRFHIEIKENGSEISDAMQFSLIISIVSVGFSEKPEWDFKICFRSPSLISVIFYDDYVISFISKVESITNIYLDDKFIVRYLSSTIKLFALTTVITVKVTFNH